MVTIFDTNVLIYAFDPVSKFHQWADETLFEALSEGSAAINPVILAELCVGDAAPGTVRERLEGLGMTFLDLPCSSAERAAGAFAACLEERKRAGATETGKTPLPDFFIGAHAELLGAAIATVDTARYRTYFPKVSLLTP